MLKTNYLRSIGIDESTIRSMERDNTYKEQYSESMKDEWRYQDDNLSANGHLVSGKSLAEEVIGMDDLEGIGFEYDYDSEMQNSNK